jgi:predicted XRE-type DNA-binding protein
MTPASEAGMGKAQAEKALKRATKDWRAAKKRERAARDELAVLVRQLVEQGILSENKVASLTDIPRMTIRKMLGKD